MALRISNPWTSPCQDGQDPAGAPKGCSCALGEWDGRGKPCPCPGQDQQRKRCTRRQLLNPPGMAILHWCQESQANATLQWPSSMTASPMAKTVPSHICVHTYNKETNQLKASKHELERGKHMSGLSRSREMSILECHLVAVVPKLYSCALGKRRNTCLVAKGCSRACLEISAQRRREMLLADKYFTHGHRFQLAPGIKSSQDIFLIKPRGFLSSL